MSDWSDLGLPPFQVSGYGYGVDAQILRTPFKTSWPNQARRNKHNLKTFQVTVLLTTVQLKIAETFLRSGLAHQEFTADLLTGRGTASAYAISRVRVAADYQVSGAGQDLYQLSLVLEGGLVEATRGWMEDLDDDWPFAAFAKQGKLMCNWQASDAPSIDWVSLAMSSNGQIVFGATYSDNATYSAIMRSTNYGQHWANEYDPGAMGVYSVVCSASGDIAFAANWSSGIWRKKDGAWAKLAAVTGRQVKYMACSSTGQKVIGGNNNSKVWVSTNYGDSGTWVQKTFPESGNQFGYACAADFSRIYIAVQEGGLYRCTDGSGTSWTEISAPAWGTKRWYETRCSADGMVVLSVAETLVATSTDGGASWTDHNLFASNGKRCAAVSGDGNTLVVAQGTAGVNNIFYSRDRGATWKTCDNTFTILWTSIAVSYDGSIAVGSVNDSHVYFVL
jgi:hypothetical protein